MACRAMRSGPATLSERFELAYIASFPLRPSVVWVIVLVRILGPFVLASIGVGAGSVRGRSVAR